MITNKRLGIRMMLFSMLLVSIFFLSVVSATPNNIKEANAKYTVGSTEIILNNHPDSNRRL
jgi:hypothetical protein